MGINASFFRLPVRLSGILVDQNFDLHDTENPEIMHRLITRFIDAPSVTSPIPPYPPVCDFIGTPLTGQAPLTVRFADHSLNNPTLWRWYFEPEWFPVEEQNPVHVFAAPGTYTVGLYVTNEYGEAALTKSDYIVATALPPPPPANLFRDPGFESGIWRDWAKGGDWEGGHDVEIGTAYKRTGSYGAMLATNHGHGLNDSVWIEQVIGDVRVDSVEFYYSIKNVPPEGGYAELLIREFPSNTYHRYPIPNDLCDFTLFHQDGPWIGAPGTNIILAYVLAHGYGHYYSPDKFRVWLDDFFAPPHV